MKNFLSFAFILFSLNLFAQHEAKLAFDWASSVTTANAFYYENDQTTDVYGNVYTLGTTINTSGNTDIMLVKYNSSGVVQWEQIFNGTANAADQGGKLYLDAVLNVYVTGYATDNVLREEDLVLIKYNSAGTQQWVQYFNGAGNKKDGGTAICQDNLGNLYVAGTAYAAATKNDFVLVKYTTSGVFQWSRTYDYNGNNELATGVSSTGSQVVITGGSEASTTQWQYAAVTYITTGVQFSVSRGTVQSNSFSSIRDVYKDGSGNTYIAGTLISGGGDNIYLAKLDGDLNVAWTQNYGGPQNETAVSIATDGSGNVYVAGETTTSTEGKNMLLLKYNSSGTLQWAKQLAGDGNGDDAFKDMKIKGDLIFLAGYATNVTMDYAAVIYNTSGELLAYQYYEGASVLEDKATNIAFDDDGLLISGTSQNAVGHIPTTVRYDYVNILRDIVSDASNPLHNNAEVIIKFERDRLINHSKINNEKITFGTLSDFVHSSTIDAMKLKLNTDANMGAWKLVKIFLNEKTSDTIDTNPTGDTILRPHFYSVFRLIVPSPFDEQALADSLDSIPTHTVYCHLNTATALIASANDTKYSSEQRGLFTTVSGLENAHINIEEAWDVETGHPAVRVAVFDAGVRFTHEDFTQSGVSTGVSNSVFYDGFNYHTNKHLKDDPDNGVNNHGSNVAGIIGAVRNNSTGVAGIAGGDATNASAGKKHGVSMYSMKIVANNGNDIASSYLSAITDANRVFSATIYNHSWIDNTDMKNFNTFEDVMWQTYRKGVLHVCGVGNDGDATKWFPASFDDEWVINVGSNNSDGFKSTFSNTSPTLDFIAPGEANLYMAPRASGNSDYGVFPQGGTSFSTPHVTGVAALMQSHTVRHNRETLLPDDIQTLLRRNAEDVVDVGNDYFVGRDIKSGFGRIDAGKVLKKLQYPKNYVRHFKATGTLTATKVSTTDLDIDLRENFGGLSVGMFKGERHEVTIVSNHNLPGTITIKDSWVTPCVNSGGRDMSLLMLDIGRSNHAEFSGSVTNASCTLKTFVYKITKNSAGTALPQPVWVPSEPTHNNVKLHYSLLLEDNSANVSVHEQEDLNNSVEIYPVPTSGDILNFSTDIAAEEIKSTEIFSVDGKLLQTHALFAQAQNNEYTLDVSALSAGVYFIRFAFSDDRSTTKKFIIIR